MRRSHLTLLCLLLLPPVGCASMVQDDYPYDRSVTGCVRGDCQDGQGVYVYSNDDIYKGAFRDGLRHGQGEYFCASNRRWSSVTRWSGNWISDKKHGTMLYVYPDSETRYYYFYYGEDVTDRVFQCRDAKVLSNVYKFFVSAVNAMAAKGRGESAAKGAVRGWGAASKQSIPLAVDLTCDQLLANFE